MDFGCCWAPERVWFAQDLLRSGSRQCGRCIPVALTALPEPGLTQPWTSVRLDRDPSETQAPRQRLPIAKRRDAAVGYSYLHVDSQVGLAPGPLKRQDLHDLMAESSSTAGGFQPPFMVNFSREALAAIAGKDFGSQKLVGARQ